MHNVMIVMGFHMVATEMMKKKFGGKKKLKGGGGVKVGNGSSVTISGEWPRNCWSEKMIITASFLYSQSLFALIQT